MIEPGAEGVLVGPDAPDWLRLDREAGAELVKSNPARRVWRVTVGRRAFYAKEFLKPRPIGRLVRFFRRDPASTEWRAGRAVASRGVACPPLVAVGRGRGRGFVVSEALDGARVLSDAWLVEDRRALIAAVAGLVGGAHANGVVHGDDHPRNVLVVCAAGGGVSAVYTDLYSVKMLALVADERAVQALSQLHQWFRLRASGWERLRFLRAYCLERTGGVREAARAMVRRLAPAVAAESRRQAFRLWAKRDRRILRTNAYFAEFRLEGDARAHVALPSRRAGVFPEFAVSRRSPAEWGEALENVVRSGATRESMCCEGDDSDGGWGRVRVTRFAHGDGTLRGRESFLLGHFLRNRDLPVRWPVACVVGSETSLLIESDLERTESLLGVLRAAPVVRRQACAALARTVWCMAEQATSIVINLEDSFAFHRGRGAWIIGACDGVGFAGDTLTPDRLRAESALSLCVALVGAGVFRKTDGVRFLKGLEGVRWKTAWRSMADCLGQVEGIMAR